MVDPVEYITQFDEVPYMVAVAAETMGIATHKQVPCVFSPTELVDRAESAINKYPVHAYEIGLVTLAMLADGIIPDLHPGIGPMGGIVSALTQWPGPIFVLAGDMPSFSGVEIANILQVAQVHPSAYAVCASTDRLHPCAAVYTQHVRPILEARVSRSDYTLFSALEQIGALTVPVAPEAARNVNLPGDVPAAHEQRGIVRS